MDIQQVGHSEYTPLHEADAVHDPTMIELLLARGADPHAKITVDVYTTPLEEAEAYGLTVAAHALRPFIGEEVSIACSTTRIQLLTDWLIK